MLGMLWVLWGIVLVGGLLGVWSLLRSSPRQLFLVLLIPLIAFALRGGITTGHFYGLEYEDAFVYAAASRWIASTGSDASFGGLTVCAVGSLEHCSMSERFPGHLPGLPALLYAAQSFVGFHRWLAPTIGALVSSMAVLVVWWAAWVIYQSRAAATTAALLLRGHTGLRSLWWVCPIRERVPAAYCGCYRRDRSSAPIPQREGMVVVARAGARCCSAGGHRTA